MRVPLVLVSLVPLVALAVPRHPADAAPASYRAVDLGVLPGATHSIAKGINARGQVVGVCYFPPDNTTRAFLWEKGRMMELPSFGGPSSFAWAIDDRGEAAGWAEYTTGGRYAVVWRRNGIQEFGQGEVLAISDSGVVAIHTSHDEAVLWNRGVRTDLGNLGLPSAAPQAINNRGQAAGYARTSAGDYHAFLWSRGVMSDLGTLGGSTSQATGINEHGDVVGFALTAAGDRFGFLWSNGVMQQLPGPTGGATAINNQGTIVGTAVFHSPEDAAVWNDGVIEPLPALSSDADARSQAYAINARGQIVGASWTGGTGSPTHAVMWTR